MLDNCDHVTGFLHVELVVLVCWKVKIWKKIKTITPFKRLNKSVNLKLGGKTIRKYQYMNAYRSNWKQKSIGWPSDYSKLFQALIINCFCGPSHKPLPFIATPRKDLVRSCQFHNDSFRFWVSLRARTPGPAANANLKCAAHKTRSSFVTLEFSSFSSDRALQLMQIYQNLGKVVTTHYKLISITTKLISFIFHSTKIPNSYALFSVVSLPNHRQNEVSYRSAFSPIRAPINQTRLIWFCHHHNSINERQRD